MSFFLLLIISLPFFYTVVMQLKQKQLKLHAQERLERQFLQTVILPSGKLKWNEKGKELLIDGRLFDVKSYKFENDKVVLKGIYDDEESILLEQLENAWDQSQSEKIIGF